LLAVSHARGLWIGFHVSDKWITRSLNNRDDRQFFWRHLLKRQLIQQWRLLEWDIFDQLLWHEQFERQLLERYILEQ
jgi:hypothetical protein